MWPGLADWAGLSRSLFLPEASSVLPLPWGLRLCSAGPSALTPPSPDALSRDRNRSRNRRNQRPVRVSEQWRTGRTRWRPHGAVWLRNLAELLFCFCLAETVISVWFYLAETQTWCKWAALRFRGQGELCRHQPVRDERFTKRTKNNPNKPAFSVSPQTLLTEPDCEVTICHKEKRPDPAASSWFNKCKLNR